MIKTLIIDANNLLKIGFHGVKDYYHNGNHIGGVYGIFSIQLEDLLKNTILIK